VYGKTVGWKGPVNRSRFLAMLAAVAAGTLACEVTQAPVPTAAPPGSAASASNRTWIAGQVLGFYLTKVTLYDQRSFSLGPETRVTRSKSATSKDLRVGLPVIVTSRRQTNGSLHAAIVDVFSESAVAPDPGQLPADAGRLATVGTVEQVGADGLTVRYPDGAAPISLGADTRWTTVVSAARDELAPGAEVSVLLQGSLARLIVLRGPDTAGGAAV
jgi:hypothetical protein